jgi:hypothetical protein
VNKKYRLQYKIGSDNLNEIYLNILIKTRITILSDDNSTIDINIDEKIAIKFKYISINPSLLREEVEIYKSLIKNAEISTVY